MTDMDTKDGDSEDVFIDALPYLDGAADAALKREVDQLIAEELKRSTKKPQEYLDALGLPVPELKHLESALVKSEMDRIAAGKEQTPLNEDRYRVEPPSAQQKDNLDAWKKAVENAQAQLEQQTLRLVNLELMKKFGGTAWKTHTEQLSALKDSLSQAVTESKKEVESINRKRKADQLNAKPLLDSLERQFHELSNKNNEIETVCWALERDIKRLKPNSAAGAGSAGASDFKS